VEQPEELDALLEIGVQYAQGYLLGHPAEHVPVSSLSRRGSGSTPVRSSGRHAAGRERGLQPGPTVPRVISPHSGLRPRDEGRGLRNSSPRVVNPRPLLSGLGDAMPRTSTTEALDRVQAEIERLLWSRLSGTSTQLDRDRYSVLCKDERRLLDTP
jgi:hypothetical protein